MKSSEQETGRLNARQVISAARQQQAMSLYLNSAQKKSTAAWAGPAGIALLFLAGLVDFAVNRTNDVDSAAYATLSTAAGAMPSAEYAVAARIGEAAAAPAKPDAALPAGDTDRGGGSDGNVMTYEHD